MDNMKSINGLSDVYDRIKTTISNEGYTVIEENTTKPWGAYIRIADEDAENFIKKYFSNQQFDTYENLSPKYLLVAPGKRLSWQKHYRRAELWTVIEGPVGVKTSPDDSEPDKPLILSTGSFIEYDTEIRHRLIGLEGWGVIAEIWKHTRFPKLSDESDIVRIQDDFSR